MGEALKIGIVIPALNEEEAIGEVLSELREATGALVSTGDVSEIMIVVADNGSTDRTGEVALSFGALVQEEARRGYGQACLAGLARLRASGMAPSDLVVFLDADHSDFPDDLAGLVAPLMSKEADLVIGSRVLGGASMDALLPQAWFGNRLCCLLMKVFFGARYTDLGPFRALTWKAFEHLEMVDTNFGWTIEMQLKAHRTRMRVLEVPVRYRSRIGTSKITGTLRGTVGAGTKILLWIFGWRLKTWFSRGGIPMYR